MVFRLVPALIETVSTIFRLSINGDVGLGGWVWVWTNLTPWVTGPICREFDALQDDVCTVDSTFIVMEIIGKM